MLYFGGYSFDERTFLLWSQITLNNMTTSVRITPCRPESLPCSGLEVGFTLLQRADTGWREHVLCNAMQCVCDVTDIWCHNMKRYRLG
jgi:hypothetical protein